VDLRVNTEPSGDAWLVHVHVTLDRRETSELFLQGDRLVSWPTEGMVSSLRSGPLERSSMFLSEIVARPSGLRLEYESEELADRAAKVLVYQVRASVGKG
jgi:hypothetical protein